MDQIGEYLINLLAQFGGGPGPPENNLARFGLAAVFWAVLLLFAWSRQRRQNRPREVWLLVGFGLALFRELFMFGHVSMRIITGTQHSFLCAIVEPLEHALTLAAMVVIGGSFIRYILDDARLAGNYLRLGLGATALGCTSVLVWWPRQLAANPDVRFHDTWQALLLHSIAITLIASAVVILARRKGWLRNVVLVALLLFFLSETLVLVNLFTERQFSDVICPIGNNFYIWAIPLFGFVYFQEQAREKRQAEEALGAYRHQLEELVRVRTAALTEANDQLHLEVQERAMAEAKIAQRNAELAAQNAIARAISQSLDLDTILRATLESTLTLLEMSSGCLFLVDPNEGQLVLQMHQGIMLSSGGEEECALQHLCRNAAQQAAADLRPVVMDTDKRLALDPSTDGAGEGLRTLVGTPLVAQGRVVGVLTLGSARSAVILPEELDLLTAIGQQVGIAVENAQLHARVEQAAALEERQRIAAEMHDGLAQTLSYLSLKADQAAEMLQQGKGNEVLKEFRRMRSAIDQTSRDIRGSIAILQHGRPTRQSLQEALGQTVSKVSEGGQTPVEIISHLKAPLFLPTSELEQVVRVVTEALWNAQRHAAAEHIVVYLESQGDRVQVVIEDDGLGFDAATAVDGESGHFGLSIMRARAAHIHGELWVDSQPGLGTQVTLAWPAKPGGKAVEGRGIELSDGRPQPEPVAAESRG